MNLLSPICLFYATALLTSTVQDGPSSPGEVVGWGINVSGQAIGEPLKDAALGTLFVTGAVIVAHQALTNATAIAAGDGHALAVLSDGTVAGWGWNVSGQATGTKGRGSATANRVTLFGGESLRDVRQVAAGHLFSLALRTDGTVAAWGELSDGQPIQSPERLKAIVAISAGWDHALALRKDGTLFGWGRGALPPRSLTNVVAIAASRSEYGMNLALTSDGIIHQWDVRGSNESRVQVAAGTNVIEIAAGWNHSLALLRDGTVFGWGLAEAATGVPTAAQSHQAQGFVIIGGKVLTNVTAIAAGDQFSLALRRDGSVIAWGRMQNGLRRAVVPGGLSGVSAIAAGDDFCTAITTNDWHGP